MLDVGYFFPRSSYISGVLRAENPDVLRASFARTRLMAVDVFFGWRAGFCDASVRYLIVQVPRKTAVFLAGTGKSTKAERKFPVQISFIFGFHVRVGDCTLNNQVPASCTGLPFMDTCFFEPGGKQHLKCRLLGE